MTLKYLKPNIPKLSIKDGIPENSLCEDAKN